MPDVLNQQEVEALLAAVEQGDTPTATEPAPSQEATSGDVSLYDFKRPERVSKDHMRALQSLHEGFGRSFGAAMSGFLRTIVEARLVSVEQLTYSEFIFSLDNPTCFNLLTVEPLDGHTILEINPGIIFPVLDRLLGGAREETSVPKRPLTEIELRLVSRITDLAITSLRTVWSNLMDIDFKVLEVESNPQLVQIVPPNEVVVLIGFELALADLRGLMNLCIPFNVIEPLLKQLSANSWFGYNQRQPSAEAAESLSARLTDSRVDLTVYLAEAGISMADLVDLKPGDVIPTDKNVNSDLLVCVEGVPKFRAKPGQFKGHKAVQLTRHCSPRQRVN